MARVSRNPLEKFGEDDACEKPHPRTLPETNPDSVMMRTLQPPLSWQLYMHLSTAGSEAASDVDTVSVLNSFPRMIVYIPNSVMKIFSNSIL